MFLNTLHIPKTKTQKYLRLEILKSIKDLEEIQKDESKSVKYIHKKLKESERLKIYNSIESFDLNENTNDSELALRLSNNFIKKHWIHTPKLKSILHHDSKTFNILDFQNYFQAIYGSSDLPSQITMICYLPDIDDYLITGKVNYFESPFTTKNRSFIAISKKKVPCVFYFKNLTSPDNFKYDEVYIEVVFTIINNSCLPIHFQNIYYNDKYRQIIE